MFNFSISKNMFIIQITKFNESIINNITIIDIAIIDITLINIRDGIIKLTINFL